ncbi:GTP-binding A, partial [Paramuricea clavata]
MNSSTDNLERCAQRTSILLIGSSGAGKSATINHLLETGKGNVVAKTGKFKPETKTTSEILVTIDDHDHEASDLTLGVIDTPGLNDPRGLKQDACNLYSTKHFFETHPLYSKTKCSPNLIFLLVSANDHRIEGNNSGLAKSLRALKELDIVDKHRPNVVAVLTFCCSVPHFDVSQWEAMMKEKKVIISRNICEALGIQAPVVLLENDKDSNNLANDGDFTLLPNNMRQPENLHKTCRMVLEKNGDHYGLSTFNACFAKPNAEKPRAVLRHNVKANDISKHTLSKDEEDLLNVLRGGAKG